MSLSQRLRGLWPGACSHRTGPCVAIDVFIFVPGPRWPRPSADSCRELHVNTFNLLHHLPASVVSRRPGQPWRPQRSPAAGDTCAAGPRAVRVQAALRERVTGDGGARGPAGAATLLTGTPATRPSLPPRKGPSGYGQSHPFVPPSKPGPVTCFRHPRDAGSERQSLRRTRSGPAPAILGPECPAPDTPTLRGHRPGALLLAQSADTAADDFVGVAGCQTPCWVLRT